MASNFPVALAYAATKMMQSTGIPERSAQAAVERLMTAAVQNIADKGPVDAMTGPVVRGDAETIRKHLEMLSSQPELQSVYRALSEIALRAARERGTDPQALAAIRNLLFTDSRKSRDRECLWIASFSLRHKQARRENWKPSPQQRDTLSSTLKFVLLLPLKT